MVALPREYKLVYALPKMRLQQVKNNLVGDLPEQFVLVLLLRRHRLLSRSLLFRLRVVRGRFFLLVNAMSRGRLLPRLLLRLSVQQSWLRLVHPALLGTGTPRPFFMFFTVPALAPIDWFRYYTGQLAFISRPVNKTMNR